MRRTTGPLITDACGLLCLFLAALMVVGAIPEASAEQWVTFAADGSTSGPPAPSPFLTNAFLTRLMGVGSTPPPPAAAAHSPYYPLAGSSTISVPAVARPVPGTVSPDWDRRREFFFDAGEGVRERPAADLAQDDADSISHWHGARFLESAFRGGWWQVSNRGSPLNVGQYQGLGPSPFWDVDTLRSDGIRTLDMFASGLDSESIHAGLYYFSPYYSADVRYQRFLHRLDHDPLDNMSSPASGDEIVSEDLNVGEDYAIRVQDLKTDFEGNLTKDIKYRINLWLRRRKGERQALGTHHGAPGDTDCLVCHVENQRQKIDWVSVRIEPSLEARLGPVTASYSRPMRSFSANDETVTRSYGGFHAYDYSGDFPYAVVPDTLSQTDRLRLGVDLPANSRLYSQMYYGDTRNQVRDTRRRYYGYDIRLTSNYSRKLILNGFARFNRQQNQLPPFLVLPASDAVTVPTAIVPPYGLRHPVDYLRTSAGGDARWRPFQQGGLAGGLAFNAGGEYGLIKRSYSEYVVQNPAAVIDQDRTPYTSYFAGTTMRWHPRFDTYLRYKGRVISDPLYGVNLYSGVTNTSLPEREDTVQFGGTWVAATNLIASASIGIENRQNHSDIAEFVEDNYPMTFTLWYAPNPAWSISGGYGYYSNWIDQDILFPSDDPASAPLDRREWNYGGRAQVLSLGSSYDWTETFTLSAGLQYIWAFDAFDPFEPWPDLPAYSDVIVNMTRYTAGVDWYRNERVSAYMRYVFEDYDDGSVAYGSGSAHMFLGGFTAFY